MTYTTRTRHTATIANGASLSDAIYIGDETLVGIEMPAAWTAGVLTFQVSSDGMTFLNLYDASTEFSLSAAAASLALAIEPVKTAGWSVIKVRSGTAGTPANQGAERSIVLITRPVD